MSQHTWRSVYILFMTVTPTVTVRLNSSYHTCQSDDSFVRNLSSYPGFAVSHFSRSILFWFPPVGTLLLLLFHPLTLRHIKALVAFSLASHSTWRSVHIFSIKAAPTALSRLRIPMRVIFDWYFPPLLSMYDCPISLRFFSKHRILMSCAFFFRGYYHFLRCW